MLRYMWDNIGQNKFVRRVSDIVPLIPIYAIRDDISQLIFRRVFEVRHAREKDASRIIKLKSQREWLEIVCTSSKKRKGRCISLITAGCFRRIRPG